MPRQPYRSHRDRRRALPTPRIPVRGRTRLVVAAALGAAAFAFGAALVVSVGGSLDARLLALVPLPFAAAAAGVGAAMTSRLADARDGGEAARVGTLATLVWPAVYGLGLTSVLGLYEIAHGNFSPFEGGTIEGALRLFGLLGALSLLALPFGALAMWGAWHGLRRAL